MTQSELILQVLGTSVDEVVEAHNRAVENGETIVGFTMPIPSIEIMKLPVVFSNNVKKVEALVITNQGARSDEVQATTLPTPTPSDRNEQESPEPSVAMGNGNGEDRRDDQHTPPPIPESLKSETDPDSKSTCNFI